MKSKLHISKAAIRDMEQILQYTRHNFGELKCEQYKQLIREALRDIARNPTAFPAKHRPELGESVFTFHLTRPGKRVRHLFGYRVTRSGCAEISRLLHDSMDLGKHLSAHPD